MITQTINATECELNIKHEDQVNKGAVDISFQNISYSVQTKKGERLILNNMTGVCKSGTVTAILGPSGGGKTSLLNVLSGKIKPYSKNVILTGDILANGRKFSDEEFSKFSGYVMQNDILLETLTVKECLQFSADLKLSGTPEYKQNQTNKMISLLKLEKCQNTMIGGHFVKGVSGGERKRVNIGQELITNPSVIFLDEPTSGLDSFTAYIVINILRNYAKDQKKTVIMSIHSPNTDIWSLFDNVMLLVAGNYIYQGAKEQAVPYFNTVGLKCPVHQCAPDFFMSNMTVSEKNDKVHPHLFESYKQILLPKIQQEMQTVYKGEIQFTSISTSFFYQINKIQGRNLKQIKRNPLLLRSRLVQTIFMALFMGLVYLDQPSLKKNSSTQLVYDRKGVLFSACMGNFMQSMMGVVINFPLEKPVFLREENSKYYTTLTYLIGKLSLEWLLLILFPIIYSSILYFMVGLNQESSEQYLFFTLILILLGFTGSSLGLISGSAFNSLRAATAVQPLFMLPFVLFSGFFKNRKDFADWIGWIEFLSPFKYALEAVVTNEFQGLDSPIDMIKLNAYEIGKWHCALILFCIFIIFQTMAGTVLHFKRGSLQ